MKFYAMVERVDRKPLSFFSFIHEEDPFLFTDVLKAAEEAYNRKVYAVSVYKADGARFAEFVGMVTLLKLVFRPAEVVFRQLTAEEIAEANDTMLKV